MCLHEAIYVGILRLGLGSTVGNKVPVFIMVSFILHFTPSVCIICCRGLFCDPSSQFGKI